jgi:hypothetical protein
MLAEPSFGSAGSYSRFPALDLFSSSELCGNIAAAVSAGEVITGLTETLAQQFPCRAADVLAGNRHERN